MPTFKACPECGSPKIRVVSKGRRPWELCIDPNFLTKEEYNNKNNKKAKKQQAH
jgi:hypothetical protein